MEDIMSSVLSELEPKLLWQHFDEIRKHPHCSKSEKPLGDYVLKVAERNGCEADRDDAGNIVIRKPATPGNENSPGVVLQGHLDMVCEKNSDVEHDFSKDPIEVLIEGDWVKANGTTLGADNGIGLAASLAVLEDDSVVHGPLELLFTTDEETGLNGAREIRPDFLKGRILLNLDSEEEDAYTISCAGGADSDIALPLKRKSAADGTALKVSMVGLRGGHSGIDIHTGRGNAIQLLARMLYDVNADYDLVSLEGGSKHNAIPREAFAIVQVKSGDADEIKKQLQELFENIKYEYKAVEKEINLNIEAVSDSGAPLDDASKMAFLRLIVGLPHGVMAMSQEIPGLVETSNNLAIVKTKDDVATALTSTRSSIHSALEAIRKKIETISLMSGANIEHLEGYPAWSPNLESPLLAKMKTIHKEITGKDPEIMAIHAGLECGIIGDKFEGMDMISFGPELKNPHSPDEKVNIGSVGRFWDLLLATLKALL
jgi:dipeptidase D